MQGDRAEQQCHCCCRRREQPPSVSCHLSIPFVTAPSITGPWSDPVPVHARGFDPSLYHDPDGRSWLLSVECDWRPGRPWAGGIIAQEYHRRERRLVGEPVRIFAGTSAGMTEGPHLYRRGGWYYLITAEGGTSWEHQVTVARSRSVLGPYEADPAGPMLTSLHRPDLALQKAGHGSLVATAEGEWFLAHLVGRPLEPRGRCVLGRETALQRVEWTGDDWPRVRDGIPAERIAAPALPEHRWQPAHHTDNFTGPELAPRWSTLRRPASEDWVSLTERPGHLRLRGGRSPSSRHDVSIVGQRVQHLAAVFETVLEFRPTSFQEMAGLIAYYNTRNWHYLRVSRHGKAGTAVDVLSCDRGRLSLTGPAVPVGERTLLRAELDRDRLRLDVGEPGGPVTNWLGTFDASILSDEYAVEFYDDVARVWGFTGMFFGLCAHDLSGGAAVADFDHVSYRPLA
ncbi:family 43 glycosylhydrolase [Micromonospora sp. MS34]|uniref:family 43 glycosylhydrolase n=1 Tax=Micromonospora sp. MS34 TaxID=3385971 RepID=UPI0039A309D5